MKIVRAKRKTDGAEYEAVSEHEAEHEYSTATGHSLYTTWVAAVSSGRRSAVVYSLAFEYVISFV